MQLEVNINSYGKVLEDDYEKDSHIWREIEEIKKIKDEGEFYLHKELLIYYLSLMLKEDWERSKQEVKGYSRTLIEVILIPIMNCIMGVYYAYKLDSGFKDVIDILMITIIVTFAIYTIYRFCCNMRMWKMVKNSRINKTYVIRILISYTEMVVIAVIVWGGLWLILSIYCSELYWLNLFSCGVVVGEVIFVYLNWVDFIGEKVRLARIVINVRQEFLGKKRLEQYENNLKEMYDYITENKLSLEEAKSIRKLFKKLKVEYKTELNDRKKC